MTPGPGRPPPGSEGAHRAVGLRLEEVTVTVAGRRLLRVPNLAVTENETLVVMGENGSGKTTLARVMGLLQSPSTGRVFVDGAPVKGGRSRRHHRRRILTQLQQTVLLDGTVRWNVTLPVRLRREAPQAAARRADHWLDRFGLQALAERHVARLSGGEARRTALARAFAAGTELLILDEPTAGLDAPFRRLLIGTLREALHETPGTVVIVTHDISEAVALADRVVVLAGGEVQQVASPMALLHRPANSAVARLVGLDTFLPGRGETIDGTAYVHVGRERLAVGKAVGHGAEVHLAIRPEDVTLWVGDRPPATSAQNQLRARVVALEPQGLVTIVRLDAGFPLSATVLPGTAKQLGLSEGTQVWAGIKATAIRVI